MTAPTAGPSTRSRLLAAAARLFVEKGFHASTTGEIARAVGISQPSLYKHFPTKDDILIALHKQVLEPAIALLHTLLDLPAPAVDLLYRFLHEAAVDTDRSPYPLAALLAGPELTTERFRPAREINDELDGLVAQLVARAQAEGDLRDLDPALAATLLLGVVENLAIRTRRGDAAAALEFAMRGVLTAPHRLEEIRIRADTLRPTISQT